MPAVNERRLTMQKLASLQQDGDRIPVQPPNDQNPQDSQPTPHDVFRDAFRRVRRGGPPEPATPSTPPRETPPQEK